MKRKTDLDEQSPRMEKGPPSCRAPSVMWLVLVSCGVFFVINILQLDWYIDGTRMEHIHYSDFEETMKGFLVKTEGCRIPDMDPFDKSIIRFIKSSDSVRCKSKKPPLVDSNHSSIFINWDALSFYGNYTDVVCCYRNFFRIEPKKGKKDGQTAKFSRHCEVFNISAEITSEYIEVACVFDGHGLYKDYFSFVPAKPYWSSSWAVKGSSTSNNIVSRNEFPGNSGSPKDADSSKELHSRKKTHSSKELHPLDESGSSWAEPSTDSLPSWKRKPLNVLMLGLDAISRLNFIRQMPKTEEYLRHLAAYRFVGFNKVGDNTFPNLVPAFVGKTETEITSTCWNDGVFDDCDFVWKRYKKEGFVTAFAEDSAWMSMFYYQKDGFRVQPTDYYWLFFNAISERNIGNTHNMNCIMCVGSRFVYKVFIDYIYKFTRSLYEFQKPYFGFFWSNSISHDYLNRPRMGDDDYYKLLKHLNESGYLDNTVLIVMSDHGIRWGGIRGTYQGMVEERLPILYVYLPEWYKAEFPNLASNMMRNTRQLVTPFDLHETLKDLVHPYDISHPPLNNNVTKRGYSLFEKIPESRTCENANISSHWCTCQNSIEVQVNDSIVVQAAAFTVDYINLQLKDFPLCVNLTLDKIFSGRVQKTQKLMIGGVMLEDYTIILRTRPNGALFEVTVRHHHTKTTTQHFSVVGTISRINLYSDQSRCISDYRMKLYCFCKEFIK